MDRKLLNTELGRLTKEEYLSTQNDKLVLLLDNVRSAHNVGSAFRSADCFKVGRVVLCGISPVPPSALIHKTALGAESVVPFEYFKDSLEAARKLKDEGYVLVAVEQTCNSVSLENFEADFARQKYAFILGNEVDGVQQELVDLCDYSLEIPQFGTKHSLNVSVATGIVLWHTFGRYLAEHSKSEE